MTKEELALAVIERLKQEYPDADCTLDYDQAWKLLVSVRPAAVRSVSHMRATEPPPIRQPADHFPPVMTMC